MNATTYTRPTPRVLTGTEPHSFDIKDVKGRNVGANVTFYTVEYRPSEDGGGYSTRPAGQYLGAWGRATRAGVGFGPITGGEFEVRIVNNDAEAASAARDAWVSKYLKGARQRAQKQFGKPQAAPAPVAAPKAPKAPKAAPEPVAPLGNFTSTDAAGKICLNTTAAHAAALVEAAGSGRVSEFHGMTVCLTWAYQAGTWSLLDHTGKRLHDQRPS